MRKLLLPCVLVAALVVACENKSPIGPAGLGPGGVAITQTTSSTTTSTTTSVPTTTSTTTTTTTVLGSISKHYVAFQPPPNIPADMTLFFQLLTAPASITSILNRLRTFSARPAQTTENKYSVTGVYVMLNGTSGAVNGVLGNAADPLTTGGAFTGTLTATVGNCTANREFAGPLGPQTLQWTGGNTLQDCPGSPLSFSSFTMLSTSSPLPTTTSVSTTTTTSIPATTTTAPICAYTLAPTSASVGSGGGSAQVVIGTLPACPWTAQSFAPWLSVTPPSGTGPAAVTYVATPNTTSAQRTGTLVIAGNAFVVTQPACTYTFSPNGAEWPAGGTADATFTITPASGCPWTVQSDSSWLSVTSPSPPSGTGIGTVHYAVAATTVARMGNLVVGGSMFSVDQFAPIQTTTTTSTSTTTTTTSIIGSTARHYVAFQPPPNMPGDMTLFFQLMTAPASITSIFNRLQALSDRASQITENKYTVTGVYVMLNGASGAVAGELSNAADPPMNDGAFRGTLTATVGACTAKREFAGPLGPQTLQWTGGNTLQDCPGSPLSFPVVTQTGPRPQ